MLSTGFLSRMVTAFISGDENLITKLIEHKLESMGEDALMELFGGPLAMAGRVGHAVQTGGASEFNHLRDDWLRSMNPAKMPYQRVFQRIFESRMDHRGRQRRAKWTRSTWATSRKDWLQNRWQHNWESQPRDWHGRWMIGRLSYRYQPTKPKRKRGIKARRLRMRRRRMARKMARQLLGDFKKIK